jgi:hypothetical protein
MASKPLLIVVTPCCIQVPKTPTKPRFSGAEFAGAESAGAGFSAAGGAGASAAGAAASSAGFGGSAGACAAATPAVSSTTATAQMPMVRGLRRRCVPSR